MPPLPGCDVSARTAAAALRRAGFDVTLLANPTNARMGAALAGLGDQSAAGPDTRSVAYVCGYVSTFRDRLFLMPVEASISQDAELLTQGILGRVAFAAVAGAGSGLLLVDGQARAGPGPASFSGLARAGDGSRSGYAISLGRLDGSVAARLASALSESLENGQFEIGGFLAGLESRPSRAPTVLSLAAPGSPAWLAGEPDPPAASALPVPPLPAPPPPAATTPVEPNPPEAALPAPSPPVAGVPAPAAEEPAILTAAEINQVQAELKRIGYYRGTADGRIGPETIVAIRLYQRELGADVTGRLTRRQVDRLLRR